jgi:hypothetical protein
VRGEEARTELLNHPRRPIPHIFILETQHAESLRDCENLFGFVVRLHVRTLVNATVDLDKQPRAVIAKIEDVIANSDLTANSDALDLARESPECLLRRRHILAHSRRAQLGPHMILLPIFAE